VLFICTKALVSVIEGFSSAGFSLTAELFGGKVGA
jgi:hypothetical protein